MKSKLLIILVLFFNSVLFSQTLVDVKDTVLAGILCERFPEAMANNCTQLDLSKEAFVSDTIEINDTTIKDISPLLELTETVYLKLNNVGLDTILGDFSKLEKLEVLDLSHNEGFSYFPDFNSISNPDFHTLVMSHTDVEDVLDVSNLKNSLKSINVRNNFLFFLPDFINYPQLKYVNVAANRLTFYDLVILTQDTDTEYRLFRQRTFPLIPRVLVNKYVGESFELKPDLDSLHPNNVYNWYKDSLLVSVTTEPLLYLSSVTLEDSGQYELVVRNPAFTGVIDSLYGRPITLVVNEKLEECVELEEAEIKIQSSCNVHELFYENTQLDSITYELRSESDTLINQQGGLFVDLDNGMYQLKVSTPSCEIIYPETIFIQAKNDCDKVISPNGDGIGDQYYIDRVEMVKIVNQRGQVLNELQGPVLWDGTDKLGSFIEAGYYLLVFESGEVTAITVER